MRVVSIGYALPDPQVDNHSIANAPALFEYDACVIDPRTLSRQIEEIVAGTRDHRTADSMPIQPGATGAFQFGLGELLTQRRQELGRLLDRGGVVVLFGYPNVPHGGVSGLPGADRYGILPAPSGVQYRPPQLVLGTGGGIRAVNPSHPFSVFLDDLAAKLRYQAYWNLSAIPDFAEIGTLIGQSHGGAAVCVEFRVGPGRIVFVPPTQIEPQGKDRTAVKDALLESISRSLESPEQEQAPAWVRNFVLPGLAEARTHMEEAEQTFAEAESRLVETGAYLTEASKYLGLLWRGGRYGFEPLVRDALRLLGFTVTPDLNQPAELQEDESIALLEVDASGQTVKENAYLSLQRRIEQEFLRSGVRRKGVIVVNGQRQQTPDEREAPYTKLLENACENFGYALVPGDTLFTLVTYALESAEAATLTEIRRIILNAEGRLVVQETEEETEGAAEEDGVDLPDVALGSNGETATGETAVGETPVGETAVGETPLPSPVEEPEGARRE